MLYWWKDPQILKKVDFQKMLPLSIIMVIPHQVTESYLFPTTLIQIKKPIKITVDFNRPIFIHFLIGHNPVLFNRLVSRLADVVRERTSASRKAEVGGVVINTCGWVRGEGYNQIKHIAQVKQKTTKS